MYEIKNEAGEIQRIPIDKIAIQYEDPDTGVNTPVPITQLVVGGLDYKTINAHPFVYDRQNGYISVKLDTEIGMRRLEKEEVELIEAVLKIKEQSNLQAKNIEKDQSVDPDQKHSPRLGK